MKRINLISGINGSGKTALIETLFLSLDLGNPACLIRPFQWRGIPLGGNDLITLFPNEKKKGLIEIQTQNGHFSIELTYGPPEKNFTVSASKVLDPQARNALNQLSASNATGVSLISRAKSSADDGTHLFISQSGDTFNATGFTSANQLQTAATYLSQFAPSAPYETAERVSRLIKGGKKSKIIEYLQLLSPGVKDVAVFQDGITAQTYVETVEQKFLPLALMGGGLRALAEIVTCAMASNGGVLFIDELDSALHYTIVSKLWGVIAQIADSENVQVFAITHSRETIASAAFGIEEVGRSKDFQYARIDYLDDHHECVLYSMDELKDAVDLRVEIR